MVFLLAGGFLFFGSLVEAEVLSMTSRCYAAELMPVNEYEETIGRIIAKTNEERVRNGLGVLIEDQILSDAAALRANEQKECFAHLRPDGSRFYTVFSQFGITGTWRGENLARGRAGSHDAVMSAWLDSEGHRKNILNSNFTRIGVGYVEAHGIGYWCQLFAN